MTTSFPIPNIALHIFGLEQSESGWLENDKLPKVGEWTKIEIGYEDGKYYLPWLSGTRRSRRRWNTVSFGRWRTSRLFVVEETGAPYSLDL